MKHREVVVSHLEWDSWNLEHVAKHGVSKEEAEEIVRNPGYAVETYKGRLLLCGATSDTRVITVVVGAVPGSSGGWYVFSARPESRKERAAFADSVGNEEKS